jgi:hypothetical protein
MFGNRNRFGDSTGWIRKERFADADQASVDAINTLAHSNKTHLDRLNICTVSGGPTKPEKSHVIQIAPHQCGGTIVLLPDVGGDLLSESGRHRPSESEQYASRNRAELFGEREHRHIDARVSAISITSHHSAISRRIKSRAGQYASKVLSIDLVADERLGPVDWKG